MNQLQLEATRQLGVCNACRYCEGLCAVFPALQARTGLGAGDIDYLANLCHGCGACYYDCQYAPPHEFAINVPVLLADLRSESFGTYAWPKSAATLFEKNGLKVSLAMLIAVALFIVGFVLYADPAALYAHGSEAGAFYRVMPHNMMVLIFGGAFLFSMLSIAISLRQFWRAPGPPGRWSWASLLQATRDAGRLKNLDGGGMGCMNENERPSNKKRLYHHFTAGGFLLCFASTVLATLAHYGPGWQAPYPWWSPVVVLGTLGGLGLVIGPIGLLREKQRRDPAIQHSQGADMDKAFIWMLLLVSSTGLALLLLRDSAAMGIALAIHLGCVFAMFISLPYSKFVHGLYRYVALIRYQHEQEQSQK